MLKSPVEQPDSAGSQTVQEPDIPRLFIITRYSADKTERITNQARNVCLRSRGTGSLPDFSFRYKESRWYLEGPQELDRAVYLLKPAGTCKGAVNSDIGISCVGDTITSGAVNAVG